MRLIDVVSLDIHQFNEGDIPPYSILSHTWGAEELTYQQWEDRGSPGVSSKEGFTKIVAACKLSEAEGIDYIWVDTVCIDKTSSAELDESIQSMFNWYHDAKVCYAYLEDYCNPPGVQQFDTLGASRWFTRGWTLQELLAPSTVKFCDQRWAIFGTKVGLAKELSQITSIAEAVLRSSNEIKGASVAQRMSWLATRQTTRLEDMTYCMLGIFDVNISTIYGEREKAFIRLQEAIFMTTNDHTIFCWTWPETIPQPTWMPCLAPHPSAFSQSGNYIPDRQRQRENLLGDSITNNLGIQEHVRVVALSATRCFAMLDVRHQNDPSDHVVAIPLVKVTPQSYWKTRAEPVWRASYPASPVQLPASWGSLPRAIAFARPRMEPIDGDRIPANPSFPPGKWPDVAVPAFAAMLLQRIDIEAEPLAILARISEAAPPLLFLEKTRSPRIWHQKFEGLMKKRSFSIHLFVCVSSGGELDWRVSALPICPHEPAEVLEDRVAKLSSRVEFKIPGRRSRAVACVEFAGKEMEMNGSSLGPARGAVVRPVCLYVQMSRPKHESTVYAGSRAVVDRIVPFFSVSSFSKPRRFDVRYILPVYF